eukprot:Skav202070  [mRNA]  locus=scaffold1138:742054:746398:+ [translate_table: standard]
MHCRLRLFELNMKPKKIKQFAKGICLESAPRGRSSPSSAVLHPGNVEAPNLLRNLKASRQLPCEQQHVDSVQCNVCSSRRIVSFLHERHQRCGHGPNHHDGGTSEKMWAREEFLCSEPSIEDSVGGEEDAATKDDGAEGVVLVLVAFFDQFFPLSIQLTDLLLQRLGGCRFVLRVLILGELLSEAAQVSTQGAGLTPLPTQEAGVEHGEEERGHHNGMNQARSFAFEWAPLATLRPSLAWRQSCQSHSC